LKNGSLEALNSLAKVRSLQVKEGREVHMQQISIIHSIGIVLYQKLRWFFEYLQELKEENFQTYLQDEVYLPYDQEYDFY
jgi:hypothetical protein